METAVKNGTDTETINAYRARWLIPMSTAPIENGILITNGNRIQAIGAYDEYHGTIPADIVDLGDTVIFPAFVNVHTHLEQSPFAEPVQDFFRYLAQSAADYTGRDEDTLRSIIRENVKESERFGTIALGDFSTEGLSAEVLKDEPVFARIFNEVRGFKNYESAAILKDVLQQLNRITVQKKITNHLGMSSTWELSPDLFKNISINERHLAIHMSMTAAEIEFLNRGSGPVRQYLLSKDDFDYTWTPPRITPVQYFFSNRYYARHNILIHMNELPDTDIDLIKSTPVKVNVCVCPRSSNSLQLQPAPVKRIMEKGVNICMGTESQAISGDLDMRKEIIECLNQSGLSPESVLKFATLNGAYAIGFHKEVGSLDVGKTARCLTIKAMNGKQTDPFAAILDMSQQPVWLDEVARG